MNEQALIRERIRLLSAVVDRFVVVESEHTFQGEARELDFPKVQDSLGVEADRIRYIRVSNSPVTATAWEREKHVRDAILRGLDDLDENSLIAYSDADEIVRPDVLAMLEASLVGPMALEVRYFTYRLNWEWDNVRSDPRAARLRDLGSPDELRRRRDLPIVPNAGWHVSWLGDASVARKKIEAFSHSEMRDLLASERHLETCVSLGVDLLGRGVLRRVSDAEAPPILARESNPEYWADRRSFIKYFQAHAYNMSIPTLRRLGFPKSKWGRLLGYSLAIAGRFQKSVTLRLRQARPSIQGAVRRGRY